MMLEVGVKNGEIWTHTTALSADCSLGDKTQRSAFSAIAELLYFQLSKISLHSGVFSNSVSKQVSKYDIYIAPTSSKELGRNSVYNNSNALIHSVYG